MREMHSFKSSDLRKISLLSLVDFSRRPNQILERAIEWAKFSAQHQLPLVLGHCYRGSKFDRDFLISIQKYLPLVRVVSVKAESEFPNLSLLRNSGFTLVETPLMALLDIDIYPEIELLHGLLHLMLKENSRCMMAPCLYLSEKGSKELQRTANCMELWNKYLNFHASQFMHIAMPSSVILLHTDDYSKIGGFDEAYQGHGFEDFDFMIRLWSANGWCETTELDVATNEPYRAAMLGYGFRGKLAKLSLQALTHDVIAMHLYHPAEKKEKYYQSRVSNFEIFKQKMNAFAYFKGVEGIYQVAENIGEFFQLCEKENKNPLKYERLFDATPAHMRDKYSFHRIFKKLKHKFSI